MSTLVIAEHDNSNLKPSTLNTLAAANAIGGSVHLLVVGSACQAVADACAAVDGVEKVLLADDAAYATFELDGGIIAHINSSWCTRVRRDDLVTFQIDGTLGSAVAGLHSCYSQQRVNTPKPVWNPDEPQTIDFYKNWEEVPDNAVLDNGFKVQWEQFLRHVVEDTEWNYSLMEGAKGVQLAELGYQSSAERRWIDVPDLEV